MREVAMTDKDRIYIGPPVTRAPANPPVAPAPAVTPAPPATIPTPPASPPPAVPTATTHPAGPPPVPVTPPAVPPLGNTRRVVRAAAPPPVMPPNVPQGTFWQRHREFLIFLGVLLIINVVGLVWFGIFKLVVFGFDAVVAILAGLRRWPLAAPAFGRWLGRRWHSNREAKILIGLVFLGLFLGTLRLGGCFKPKPPKDRTRAQIVADSLAAITATADSLAALNKHQKRGAFNGRMATESKEKAPSAATHSVAGIDPVMRDALAEAQVQAMLAAIRHYEGDVIVADSTKSVSNDPEEDPFNIPGFAWDAMVLAGTRAHELKGINTDFTEDQRTSVLEWATRKIYATGVTPDSLARLWPSKIKGEKYDPIIAQAYHDSVMVWFREEYRDITSGPEFMPLRVGAEAKAHKHRGWEIFIACIVVAIVEAVAMISMTGHKRTKRVLATGVLLGTITGLAFAWLVGMPTFQMFNLFDGVSRLALVLLLSLFVGIGVILSPTKSA